MFKSECRLLQWVTFESPFPDDYHLREYCDASASLLAQRLTDVATLRNHCGLRTLDHWDLVAIVANLLHSLLCSFGESANTLRWL